MTPEEQPPRARREETSDPEEAVVAALLRSADPSWPGLATEARRAVRAHWLARLARRRRRRLVLAAAAAFLVLSIAAVATVRWERHTARLADAGALTLPVATVEQVVASPGRRVAAGEPPSLRVGGGRALTAGDVVRAGEALETSSQALAALRVGRASVRLDASTRLVVSSERSVRLDRGGVYVDSPPIDRIGAGVQVLTAFGAVRELGTQFEVRLGEGVLLVRVREGEVEVVAQGTRASMVQARHQLTIGPAGAWNQSPTPVVGGSWDWVIRAAPTPDLAGRPLVTLLEWVSRETGRDVSYAGAGVAARAQEAVLHGPLAGLTPEEALAVALPASGLEASVDGEWLLITTRRR